MSDALDLAKLGSADKAALERLILTLADSKRLMGIRYSDWLLGAPSIETGIAASSMAQDEWGHARLLYSMLKDMGIDPGPVEHDRQAAEYSSIGSLDEEMPDWAALVAAMVLVDGALSAVLSSFATGSFESAQGRVPKMLSEEEFHSSLGAAWYRRLAEAGGEAKELLTAATKSILPPTLAWVGAADDSTRRMVAAGVIAPAEDRLATFRDAAREFTALVGIDIDTVDATAEWDGSRGRTPGHPSEEAVQRARGDLNRALFVE